MGCSSSKTVKNQVSVHPEKETEGPSLNQASSLPLEKPKPVIFSIVRNGHEVVRGGLKDVGAFLHRNEYDLAVEEWRALQKWFHMHRQLELGTQKDEEAAKRSSQRFGCIGFLRVMDDHCDDISTKNNFYDDYKAVVELEEQLNAAFETNDLFQIKGFFFDYKDAVFDLLAREDEILFPQVHEMADRGLDLAKFMKRDILAGIVGQFGFESFVRYAVKMLDIHDGGMPRVRVYGFSLYSVATRKQWEQWQEWIREEVSEESFKELEEVIAGDKQ